MKKSFILLLAVFSLQQSFSQDFPGYRTGNYTGVNGVFFNPANIAGSPYRWDVNLFSLNTIVSNDHLSYKLKDIGDTFNNDSISNKLFGKDGSSSGMMMADFHGPSVMFNVNKWSVALTSRARVFASIMDVDGKLFNQIGNNLGSNGTDFPYTISSAENMRVAINAWSEFGLSLARELFSNGQHTVKGGLTLKYLAGAGNGYLNVNNLNGTLDADDFHNDAYLSNATGHIGLGFGGINLSDIEANDLLKKHGSGIGADLGVTYEFRPEKDAKNYKLKLGLALLDIGKIKYKKDAQRSGEYDINISGNERFYMNELDGVKLDNYNAFFAARPQYFTPAASNADEDYSVSLPTTLQVSADYHVAKGFFVNLASQVSLSSSKSKAFNNQTYSGFTLTPRYETKGFGVYVPVNYNSLSKFNAGLALRAGPLFIGSGCILSALASDSKQIDFHIGVRFGGLR